MRHRDRVGVCEGFAHRRIDCDAEERFAGLLAAAFRQREVDETPDLPPALRTEQRERHDGNAIRTPICVRTGVEDDGVSKPVSELLPKPMKVSNV